MLRSIFYLHGLLKNIISSSENEITVNETTMTELFKDESFSENYKKLKETAHNFHKKVYNCQNITDFVYTPHYKFLWKNSEFEDIVLTLKKFILELKSVEKKPRAFLGLLNNTLIEYECFINLYKKFDEEIEKQRIDKRLFFEYNKDYMINNVFNLFFNDVLYLRNVFINNNESYEKIFNHLNKEETLSAGKKITKFFNEKLKEKDDFTLNEIDFTLNFDCFIETNNFKKGDVISIIKEITCKFFELSNMSKFLDDLNLEINEARVELYDN
ncbi:hypothetical protein A0H76_2665 [Hepatospora eriocheir]|uniref:Uncharacterized protein n=1 Tax=Hepatospora eriocheir TaxID=1081669 RepID=A0A1X0QF36_9MICR|nr:hypothetical protein A0H76_2665 [Hepatospora eriocheir]